MPNIVKHLLILLVLPWAIPALAQEHIQSEGASHFPVSPIASIEPNLLPLRLQRNSDPGATDFIVPGHRYIIYANLVINPDDIRNTLASFQSRNAGGASWVENYTSNIISRYDELLVSNDYSLPSGSTNVRYVRVCLFYTYEGHQRGGSSGTESDRLNGTLCHTWSVRDNHAATGAPQVSGPPPRVGVSLVASSSGINDIDGLTGSTFSWRWKQANSVSGTFTNIFGATSSIFRPGSSQANKFLQVCASFTDSLGNDEERCSTINESVNNPATGTPSVQNGESISAGTMLTAAQGDIADDDGLSGVRFTWQWKQSAAHDGPFADISGATSATFSPTNAHAGQYLRVCARFMDDRGDSEMRCWTSTDPIIMNNAPTAFDSSITVTGNTHSFDKDDFQHEDPDDDNQYIYIIITSLPSGTLSDADGTLMAAGHEYSIDNISSLVYTLPATRTVRDSLTFRVKDDKGATSNIATLTIDIDIQAYATGAPTVTYADNTSLTNNGPKEKRQLTASTDGITAPDGINTATLSWQWKKRDTRHDTFANISGATNHTFTPRQAHVGKYLRLCVRFRGNSNPPIEQGPLCWTSIRAVVNVNDRATGEPQISGPLTVGMEVRARKGTIYDYDGLPDVADFRWQWRQSSNANGPFTDIAGATSTSFTPSTSHTDQFLQVCAAFTDDYGSNEQRCKASDSSVIFEFPEVDNSCEEEDESTILPYPEFPPQLPCELLTTTTTTNTPAVGTPTVSATDGTDLSVSGPRSGTVLVASARGLHDDDGIDQSTLAWQWQLADAADGTAPADDSYNDIAGATGHEFTPAYAMVGQYLRLCASFRDQGTPVADEGPLCWVSPFPVAGTDVAAQQTAQLAAAISGELLSDAEDVIGSQLDTQPTGQGFRAFAQLVQLYDGLRAAPAAAPSATGRPAYADASQMTATASRARDADHSMAHHRLAELPGTLSAAHRQHWYLGTDALAESHSAYHSRGDAASQLLQRLRSATDSLQMSWRGSGAARSLGLWARYHSTDLQGTSSTRQNAPMAIPTARMPTMGTASEGAISDAQAASGPLSWSGTGQRLYLGMEHSHSASLRTGLALGLDGAHLGADMEQDGHSDAMERTTTGIYPYLNWQLGAGNRLRIISGYGSGHIHMHSTLNRATATAPLQWRLLSANISHQTNQNGLLQGTLSGAISHSSATIGRAHFANRPTQLQGATHAAGRASLNARLTHNSSWQPFMEASARQAFGDHSQPLAYHIKGGMSRDHGPVQLRISHSRQINHSSLRQDHTNISLSISPAANIKASMDGKWDSRTGQPLATTRLDYHFHKADATLSLRTSSIGGGRWALEGRWRW